MIGRGEMSVVAAVLLLLVACNDPKVPRIQPVATAEMSAFYSDADDLRARIRVDEHLPSYDPAQYPRLGTLHLATDKSVQALAEHWAAAFNKSQPLVTVRTAAVRAESPTPWWALELPPAFALLGAPMREGEVTRFRQRWGYAPTALRVAMDPVVVLVHPDNPVAARGLTLAELEAAYGAAPHRGLRRMRSWGELGIDKVWSERGIAAYGHDLGGELAALFRTAVLGHGDYRTDMVRLPGSRAVIAAVTRDPAAVGFANLSDTAGTIALVPIASHEGGPFALPDTDNLVHDRYPLPAGGVWLYVNRPPGVILDAPRREWLRFLYSREGQWLAAELGLVPLPAALAIEELHRHSIDLAPEHALLASRDGGVRDTGDVPVDFLERRARSAHRFVPPISALAPLRGVTRSRRPSPGCPTPGRRSRHSGCAPAHRAGSWSGTQQYASVRRSRLRCRAAPGTGPGARPGSGAPAPPVRPRLLPAP